MAERNIKQWKLVIKLHMAGLTYAEVGKLAGISRQRAAQIINQATFYMNTHDDELADFIRLQMVGE